MAYGIKIYNDFGDLVVDENWFNYTLLKEGAQQVTLDWGTGSVDSNGDFTWAKTTIPISPPSTSIVPPVLFIKHSFLAAADTWVASCVVLGTPGNWTGFQVACRGSPTAVRPMYYRIYAIQPPSEAQYGLKVMGANGEVAFDSGRTQLTIERVIQPSDWVLTLDYRIARYAQQSWEIAKPAQPYICISSHLYTGGQGAISNYASGITAPVLLLEFASSQTALGANIRLAATWDYGALGVPPASTPLTPLILPIMCDQ